MVDKTKLSLVPENPGCYLMKDKDNNIIYVGKAKNLKRRVNSYFNKIQTGKTKALVDNIYSFEYIVTNSEVECLILEINLIKKYNPKYNILLKDDKTYPYIVLTNDKYPTLKIVRSKNRKKINGKVFGPYPNVSSARETVEAINRVYPLRKCAKLKKDYCLYYHINECLGYCKNNIDEEQISNMTKEITSILNGNYKLITTKLEGKMNNASERLDYEKALLYKNIIDNIKSTINKQIIVSNVKYNFDVFGYYIKDDFLTIEVLFIREGVVIGRFHKIYDDFVDINDIYLRFIIDFYEKYQLPKSIIVNDIIDNELLSNYLKCDVIIPKKGDIKKILDMANLNAEINSKEKIETIKKDKTIRTTLMNELKNKLKISSVSQIELFDNSHLFSTYYVGGMVCYTNFLPNKKMYRKYKISLDVKDDLSAMKEVIYRRYFKCLLEDIPLPDLIIVDGGETQIKVAKEVLESLKLNIKIIGLKKDDKHRTKYIIDDNYNTIEVSKELFLYLTRMQDEVHRFAITYHRNIKSKGSLSSILLNVSGIGDKRRKELLKKYSSIDKIKNASIDDLTSILPKDVAINLQKYLNNL
jgi:excinuclease ABC subunit C